MPQNESCREFCLSKIVSSSNVCIRVYTYVAIASYNNVGYVIKISGGVIIIMESPNLITNDTI